MLDMKHTFFNNKYLLQSHFFVYVKQFHKEESNLANKDAEKQMILENITYNAFSVWEQNSVSSFLVRAFIQPHRIYILMLH